MNDDLIFTETDRLILRRFKKSDLSDLYEYVSDPDTVKYEPYLPMSMEEAAANLDIMMTSDDMIAVELKEEHKMIGSIYLVKREFEAAELGYLFNKSYRLNGYAREGCAALIKKSFGEGLHRIYAECDTMNTASWKLLEALGFMREAHLRESVYFTRDEQDRPVWRDTFIYSKLNSNGVQS